MDLTKNEAIKAHLIKLLQGCEGSFNDELTRENISKQVIKFINDLNIMNYEVVCSEVNNSPEYIDSNGFPIVEIYIGNEVITNNQSIIKRGETIK